MGKKEPKPPKKGNWKQMAKHPDTGWEKLQKPGGIKDKLDNAKEKAKDAVTKKPKKPFGIKKSNPPARSGLPKKFIKKNPKAK